MATSQPIRVLVHGGAGGKRPSAAHRACLAETLLLGMDTLKAGGSALDSVEAMIRMLESSGLFNAGLGARLQLDGVKRMDASIMDGRILQAGAVASIEKILHPITAARLVMEQTDHVLLVGRHATRLARHFQLEKQPSVTRGRKPSATLPFRRKSNLKTLSLYRAMNDYDTVGAVAQDEWGGIASGSSTGGVPMMFPGRVGDSPLVGCGVYADNSIGGVSMTGLGESIIRLALAKHIAMELRHGKSPRLATKQALTELVQRVKGEAGALVLGKDGRFAIQHTSRWMGAGHWNGRGKPIVADQFH